MTPDEVESCLRDFNSTHKVLPMVLIAGESIYYDLMKESSTDDVTDNAWFKGVALMRDPLIKGIVISS